MLSVHDNPDHDCPKHDPLAVPILSLMKSKGDCDILVPQMLWFDTDPKLYSLPWEKKKDVGEQKIYKDTEKTRKTIENDRNKK
jgi:hypothetical protein